MSVPQKYRELGDFHEYYSGKRTAPYLTIFIGGNHEAGNHLFELYYGGWAAPNIYYMGAANVIRCGPLRIAAMSGIWKGYDYRKPHFERLPYNRDDIQSIYHVRELDVRKLLQIRTQVDLGLSHDWPKQVEYSGDFETLFRTKRGFRQDSQDGRLGSLAAKYVLDRLRPAYWFSAHLHVKFVASIQHGEYTIPGNPAKGPETASERTIPQNSNASHSFGLDGATVSSFLFGNDDQEFHESPRKRIADNVLNKSVSIPSEQRQDEATETTDVHPSHSQPGPTEEHQVHTDAPDIKVSTTDQETLGDTQSRISAWNSFHTVAAKNEAAENARYLREQEQSQGIPPDVKHNLTWRKIDVDEDGTGRKLTSIEQSGGTEIPETKKQKIQHDPVKNEDEIDLDLDSDLEDKPINAGVNPGIQAKLEPSKENIAPHDGDSKSSDLPKTAQGAEAEVSEELRNQLPASFARPQAELRHYNESLPDAISNTTTHFLALDKCLPNHEFLQLVEFHTVSNLDGAQCERPYRLQYDKEWLAISRVFADHLHLGDPEAKTPADKGDAIYKPQIIEAEQWIEEHVVKPGKMTIPENFEPTAPFYDPSIPITTDEMPFEYTNPQTTQFCDLVGIENKFHLSDEERQARMAAGPRPPRPSDFKGPRNHRRGGGSGPGRGRGGFGRNRGGRGNRR
ncbi:hypothetical protein EYZ11_001861 [Aspergillus tanneri]|nr:hypothetical protein EYZ11_001861 [Aspergillus tanneri]